MKPYILIVLSMIMVSVPALAASVDHESATGAPEKPTLKICCPNIAKGGEAKRYSRFYLIDKSKALWKMSFQRSPKDTSDSLPLFKDYALNCIALSDNDDKGYTTILCCYVDQIGNAISLSHAGPYPREKAVIKYKQTPVSSARIDIAPHTNIQDYVIEVAP